MARRKSKKRAYKLINFKAYYDQDADILVWWEGIEEGERSDAIRDLIREFLGIQPRRWTGKSIDLPELMEMRRDTLWIKDALNEMPSYLERVIQHVAANAQVIAVGQQTRASPAADEAALTDAETQRRTRRMRNATW